MPNLTQLRIAAREIFDAVLSSVDAGAAVRKAVQLDDSLLKVCDTVADLADRRVYSIAVGKAALPMAIALEDTLGERFAAGLIAGPVARMPQMGRIPNVPRKMTTHWRWCEGGHPIPNKTSLLAATEAFALLERADEEHAPLIFLISGGGSAMIEWPISKEITLADLRAANKALVTSGASIIEINAVRRAFSAIKGGRLAAKARNCDQITLIISDVPPGEERTVASGPSLAPPIDAPDAREIIAKYRLRSQLSEAILHAIDGQRSEPVESDSTLMRKHFVLLDNNSALEAATHAASRRGFVSDIARDISDQSIESGCAELTARLDAAKTAGPESVCLVSGGEFACPVKGDGIGGRNLETALRLALLSNGQPFVALCAGTDGIDGNSPAAGAIVDHTTIDRARAIGLDPEEFLKRSDAYSFFVALGDVVATGSTGTNVRDIRILLA